MKKLTIFLVAFLAVELVTLSGLVSIVLKPRKTVHAVTYMEPSDSQSEVEIEEDPQFQIVYKYPKYHGIINKYKGRLSLAFIESILFAESRGGTNQKFDDNGWGIMQISAIALEHYNINTASEYTQSDLSNTETNIMIGCYLLWDIIYQFESTGFYTYDHEDVYLAYNLGVAGYFKYRDFVYNNTFKNGAYNGLNNYRQYSLHKGHLFEFNYLVGM
jgi:soluble lytic murein transglycosylase-like protein